MSAIIITNTHILFFLVHLRTNERVLDIVSSINLIDSLYLGLGWNRSITMQCVSSNFFREIKVLGFGCSWKRIKMSDLQNLNRGLIILVFNYRTRIWSSFSFWIWVGTKKPYSRPKQGKILTLENKRPSPWWWLFASQIKTTTIRVNGNGIWV